MREVLGTVIIKIEADYDEMVSLCDYINENTNYKTEVDWFMTNENNFSIVCTEEGYVGDDGEYKLYDDKFYGKLIRQYENIHEVELDTIVKDLEIEEI